MLEKEEESFYRTRNMCVQPERLLSSRVLTVGSFLFRFSLGMWFIYNFYIHICLFSSVILRCHPNKYTEADPPKKKRHLLSDGQTKWFERSESVK